MEDDPLVGMLDGCIAEYERRKERRISELVAAHGESSLYTKEDALDDDDLRFYCKALEDLRLLRKKVIDGETS